MPKERPILFSAPMVRALLSGAKTQTRRLVKPQPVVYGGGRAWAWPNADLSKEAKSGGARVLWAAGDSDESSLATSMMHDVCPYGAPGDRLWVREAVALNYFDAAPYKEATERHGYRADWSSRPSEVVPEPKWTPSIHMPRWASRIDLEVTAVRVERLQAITEEDAKAEGCGRVYGFDVPPAMGALPEGTFSYPGADGWWTSATAAYRALWAEINGALSWGTSPWVWVVEFRRVRP